MSRGGEEWAGTANGRRDSTRSATAASPLASPLAAFPVWGTPTQPGLARSPSLPDSRKRKGHPSGHGRV